QAVKETLTDAQKFEQKIFDLAECVDIDSEPNEFENIFKPLSNNGISYEFCFKSYGQNNLRENTWLRIYAIKLGTNVYVITGGAIKLTERMNQAEHTKTELDKFKRCVNYLKSEGVINDLDALKDFLNEH
ncbi:MAG: hypothetical protein ABIP51_03120, partial [Bacteroidia bacterium]